MKNNPDPHTIWLYYLTTLVTLKNDFTIVDLSKQDSLSGRGEPYFKKYNTAFFKVWFGELEILSFEDFINRKGMYGYEWFLDNWNRKTNIS